MVKRPPLKGLPSRTSPAERKLGRTGTPARRQGAGRWARVAVQVVGWLVRWGKGGPQRQQRAYRLVAPQVVNDCWERRVLELADGRTVDEIVEGVYWQEIRAGAWLADAGLYVGLFRRRVTDVVKELADQGRLRLEGIGDQEV